MSASPRSRKHSSSPSAPTYSRTQPACRRCSQRKKRCDRALPRCSNCHRGDDTCVYDVVQTETEKRATLIELRAKTEAQQQQIETLQRQLQEANARSSPIIPTLLPHCSLSPTTSFTQSRKPSITDLFVSHLLNVEVDLDATSQLLVAGIAQQFNMSFPSLQSRTAICPRHSAVDSPSPRPFLASRQQAEKLIDVYMEFANCFQPVLEHDLVLQDLEAMYPCGSMVPVIIPDSTQPDIRVYRLYIIFAIGASLLPKNPSNPNTAHLRATALAHFPAALRADDLTCLTCVVLFCIYSMTDSAPMDPGHTVKIAAGLAIDLGLCEDVETIPWEERETRKRIFWSIYCMDRSISYTLNRIPSINEKSISIPLPSMVPALSGRHTTFMTPVALFRQTVFLRRLQGMVSSSLCAKDQSAFEAERTFAKLRNAIDSWFDDLPLSFTSSTWAACKHPYFEVNYYLLLVRLYSPSSLQPNLSSMSFATLRQAAYRVIEIYGAGHEGYRMRQNFITVTHIVLACTALVFTLKEGEGDPINWSIRRWRLVALHQIETAEKLLANFCCHLTYAMRYTAAFATLTNDLKLRLQDDTEAELLPPDWLSEQTTTTSTTESLVNPSAALDLLLSQSQEDSGVTLADVSDSDERPDDMSVDDFLSFFGLGSFPA